jgi:hypothetical protein
MLAPLLHAMLIAAIIRRRHFITLSFCRHFH